MKRDFTSEFSERHVIGCEAVGALIAMLALNVIHDPYHRSQAQALIDRWNAAKKEAA